MDDQRGVMWVEKRVYYAAGKTAFWSAAWMDADLVASMEPLLWAGRKGLREGCDDGSCIGCEDG